MSIRKDIRDRIIEELNANRPGVVPAATHRRWSPGETDKDLTISVHFQEEDTDRVGGRHSNLVTRELVIAVQCIGATNYAGFSDDLLEPLLVHVVETLGETNLQGLVDDMHELKTVWETAKMDKFYIAATVTFAVRFQTDRKLAVSSGD
jgi:hypothetical protein